MKQENLSGGPRSPSFLFGSTTVEKQKAKLNGTRNEAIDKKKKEAYYLFNITRIHLQNHRTFRFPLKLAKQKTVKKFASSFGHESAQELTKRKMLAQKSTARGAYTDVIPKSGNLLSNTAHMANNSSPIAPRRPRNFSVLIRKCSKSDLNVRTV